ncbi:hypothetical protein ABKV19_012046 [Rosa sericea]
MENEKPSPEDGRVSFNLVLKRKRGSHLKAPATAPATLEKEQQDGEAKVLDKHGRLVYTTFCSFFDKNRAKLVQEAWPMVESSLKKYCISCTLDQAERSITFSTTSRTRGPDIVNKARDLLELLTLTAVPPFKAIQILDGLQYDIIRTGYYNGGFRSRLPLEEQETYLGRLKRIEHSLQELANQSQCDVFLNGSSVTALGTSLNGLKFVRGVVEACIVRNVKPATLFRLMNFSRQLGGQSDNLEMDVLGFETVTKRKRTEEKRKNDVHVVMSEPTAAAMEGQHGESLDPLDKVLFGPSLNKAGMLVCGAFFSEKRAKVLEEEWPIVESSLEQYGISCTIYLDEGFMTFSTTKDRDTIYKARDVLELLSSTSVKPSLAIEVLNGRLKHDIIKTGYFNGGIGSELKIDKETFVKQTGLFKASLQDLADVSHCYIYTNGNTVAALATENGRLSLVREVVTRCIASNEDPASMIQEFKRTRV